jgi:hypothetical protein
MSAERDTTRIVRSWLQVDEHESADRILHTVLARLDATPQRRSWWPAWRFLDMNTPLRIAAGAAAVLVVALVSVQLLGIARAGPGGGPQITATPSPGPTVLPTYAALDNQQDLPAGTYRGILPRFNLAFTISVPEGWDALGQDGVGAADNSPPTRAHAILFWNVENIYVDPLKPELGLLDPPVGPSVDNLVEALVDHHGWTTTAPTDVMVGGHPGKVLELTVPSDASFDGCGSSGTTRRPFVIWTEGDSGWRCMQGPGQTDHVYVVDVDGQRVVITLVGYPDWSGTYLETLQAMVNSLEFVSL